MPVNRTVVVGTLAVAALLGLSAAGLMTARRTPAVTAAAPEPARDGQRVDDMLPARTKGAASAPILIYEVSDFQCPYCRQFWEQTLPKLEKEYIRTGKVRLTFINLPIPELHPNAQAAHEVAMCAAAQNHFWPVHDLLYAHQAAWAKLPDPTPYFLTLADSARLDAKALQGCLADGRARQLVREEREASLGAGVKSTPSFIVEGTLLAGTAPIEAWRPILDSIYAQRVKR